MAPTAYDALIVGARVAGAGLAIRLAQQGRKVLVVDRDSFPSDTISTHGMAFNAVESLGRLGVLERVEAAGFRRLYRHRAWIDDICIEVPAGPPGTYSLAPRRIVLDQIMLDRARECGAEVLERARVDGLITESGCVVGATVQMIGGSAREIRSRIVVGADGKNSKVAQWVGAEKYDDRPLGRPIYLGYFRGLTPLPEPAIELFFKSGRIGFCLPMRPDEHCLAFEAQPEEFDSIRHDPTTWFRQQYATLPGMAPRLQGAVLEGKLLGVRSVENWLRKPYGPGWALTGDAAYVKDPCTGYGIGDALLQAFWLAKAMGDYFDGSSWEPTMEAYHQRRDTNLRPLFEQTVAAASAVEGPADDLDAVRAVLMNQHDARTLMRALPRLLDQAFEPMDRFRHAVVASLYRDARQERG